MHYYHLAIGLTKVTLPPEPVVLYYSVLYHRTSCNWILFYLLHAIVRQGWLSFCTRINYLAHQKSTCFIVKAFYHEVKPAQELIAVVFYSKTVNFEQYPS